MKLFPHNNSEIPWNSIPSSIRYRIAIWGKVGPLKVTYCLKNICLGPLGSATAMHPWLLGKLLVLVLLYDLNIMFTSALTTRPPLLVKVWYRNQADIVTSRFIGAAIWICGWGLCWYRSMVLSEVIRFLPPLALTLPEGWLCINPTPC